MFANTLVKNYFDSSAPEDRRVQQRAELVSVARLPAFGARIYRTVVP